MKRRIRIAIKAIFRGLFRLLPLSSRKKQQLVNYTLRRMEAFIYHMKYGNLDLADVARLALDDKDALLRNYSKYISEAIKSGEPGTDFTPYKEHNITITDGDIKPIALYLPQFYTFPENDEWWGIGFTEWTNVTKAVPQFAGHYQPHLPYESTFYDLSNADTIRKQTELAKNYGIYGFCFHYYWFDGKRLLEKPLDILLKSDIDFPFCISWANENWSRRWDGSEDQILIAQNHSLEDDLACIAEMSKYIRDPRYIRVQGKPLVIIYNPAILPDANATIKTWRDYCRETGIGEIHLAGMQTYPAKEPMVYDFDIAIEFPPHYIWPNAEDITQELKPIQHDHKMHIYDIGTFISKKQHFIHQPKNTYKTVFPTWDNTARSGKRAFIYQVTPPLYKKWLLDIIEYTMKTRDPDDRFIFINAWNEWAEGAHLEPDRRNGYAYLQATVDAVLEARKHNWQKADSQIPAHNFLPRSREYTILDAYSTDLDIEGWARGNVIDSISYDNIIFSNRIDIIVPIYNGYEYFDALFATIRRTSVPFRLILVNDNSSDKRIAPYLEKIADTFEHAMVITNEVNSGFVKSVNAALRQVKGHAVVVNTDIELPDKWLERLITPLYKDPSIASATPMTNSGTICSFPLIMQDNWLLPGLSTDEIDCAFQKVRPVYCNIPTGIGFCMAMSYNAIEKIGFFDEDTFGRGYGEENDWCQRAQMAGFKNIMVENLFVWHKHGGSYTYAEKKKLSEQNTNAVISKHPEYVISVDSILSNKYQYELRAYILSVLLPLCPRGEVVCYFDHSLGGGANEYLNRLLENHRMDLSYVVTYHCGYKKYDVRILFGSLDYFISFTSLAALMDYLSAQGIDKIVVNSLFAYPDIDGVLAAILKMKKERVLPLTYLLHDYFAICPVYYLLDINNQFCGNSGYSHCNECDRSNIAGLSEFIPDADINQWRAQWKAFLMECDTIVAFSNASEKILESVYTGLPRVDVTPHIVDYVTPVKREKKAYKTLNIGFIGKIDLRKGSALIREMGAIIDNNNLNIRLYLFGESISPIDCDCLTQTGKYDIGALESLTKNHDIDIFIIPSIWPETFSYTTQEAIEMNMPVACFDIGAPAERVKEYEKGIIIPEMTAKCMLETVQAWAAEHIEY